jgi:hypothetical protein
LPERVAQIFVAQTPHRYADRSTRPWLQLATSPAARSPAPHALGARVPLRTRGIASKSYNSMDIVTLDKQAWLCVRDDAKGVPGVDDCWILLGARGPRGRTGRPGPMGLADRRARLR